MKIDGRDLDVRVSTTSTIWGEKTVLRLLDRTRSLYRLDELGMPPDAEALYSELVTLAVRHGDRGWADRAAARRRRLRDVVGDQPARHQRDDDRRPGRIHLPAGQPDPDQRAGGHDVRHGSEVDPAPGPRRDPRRRGSRRRDRAHRRAVRADRPPRVLVGARDRLRSPRSTACSTWASSRSSITSAIVGVVAQRLVRRSCTSCSTPYEPSVAEHDDVREARRAPRSTCGCEAGLPVLLGHGLLRPRRRLRGARRSPTRSASASSTASRHASSASSQSQQGLRTLQTEAVRLVETDVTTMEEVVKHVAREEGLE